MQIKIKDNGPGLPAGQEEKIFDKFITVKQGANRRGTGLGLAICRGIVRAHGGTIKASNGENDGAVFTITLPLATEPAAEVMEQ